MKIKRTFLVISDTTKVNGDVIITSPYHNTPSPYVIEYEDEVSVIDFIKFKLFGKYE